jgi:hypothetical protein
MKVNPPGAVAALVCGILSIVLCWFPIAGLVLGIVAILQAGKARQRAAADPATFEQGGVRVAGFVCGVVGTSLSGVYNLYWIVFALFIGVAMTPSGG